MTEREKVIKGLTKCVAAGLEKACPADCPYFLQCFPDVGLATPFLSLMADALTLLKEQPEIVRCGVCKHGHLVGSGFCICRKHETEHYHDWYCADGER